jgi:hypothetical protein
LNEVNWPASTTKVPSIASGAFGAVGCDEFDTAVVPEVQAVRTTATQTAANIGRFPGIVHSKGFTGASRI